jgi:hypothetical protein
MKESLARRIENWWAAHHRKVYAGAAVLSVVVVWRGMFFIANQFLSFSETMAEVGFLALATSLVVALSTFLLWRRRLDPETVYRRARASLSESDAVTRLLGAPLSHTETRAFVLSGGNLRIKEFIPRIRSRRCNLLFPLSGPLGRGIVSAEAKREKGKYIFKLLALDVAPQSGGARETRVYVAGDDADYARSTVLAELRDPLIAQLQAEPAQAAEEELAEGETLALESGALPPAAAAARAQAEDELYAWDHFTRWLQRKNGQRV